jgi:hypothetical protein
MLAATAGLSIRSIRNSAALDPEFRPEGMFVSSLDLLPLPPQRRGNFLTQLQDALGTMPALATASLTGEPPLGGTRRMRRVRQVGEQTTVDAALSYVTPGYFETIGATILEGQEFIPRQDTARAVIINEVIAARYWPGQKALGRYLHIDGEQIDREVRAVIRTTKCIDITDENQACLYLPLAQTAPQAAVLFRPQSDSQSAISAIRNEIRRLDPTVAVYNTKTLSEHLNNRFSGQSLLAGLATILALVGLAILVLGVFALVSFTIAQTTRSIGIRLAVGATASRIVRELLMQLAVIAGIGVGAGIAGVMALGPLIRNQLFQTSPYDPVALGGAVILLIVASLSACAIAARRIAGIDPATTLRIGM